MSADPRAARVIRRSSTYPPGRLPWVRATEVLARVRVGAPVGAELGVWRGHMSAELLRLNGRLRLYMVDSWNDPAAQPLVRRGISQARLMQQATRRTRFAAGRRTILHMDTVEAARRVDDGSLDFVFVDAEHSYAAVSRDIAAWLPRLKPGGLMCGHDYSPPGKYTDLGWPGVVQAVDEFVARTGLALDLGDNLTWFVRL